ncbi:MAG: 4-(cytidine 5'-diphospho)-2-C-methyl-D-erythritol kinase, partial [Candidatus Marinimicrobia bacterium]|nr:4-(cytidine 5'-diphospho)-2-C-methyl-D-erythritol kinase [Candidatus Neomarinimicrobiota bacterium]
WALFENAFEDVLIPAHPQIRAIKEQLLSLGAVHAGLSGSGSTVYGICKNEEQAGTAIRELSSKYTAILSRPVIR